jgi:hypothetical protein
MNREIFFAVGVVCIIGSTTWYAMAFYLSNPSAIVGGSVAAALAVILYLRFTVRGLLVSTVLTLLGAAIQSQIDFAFRGNGYEVTVKAGNASTFASVAFAALAVMVLLMLVRGWHNPPHPPLDRQIKQPPLSDPTPRSREPTERPMLEEGVSPTGNKVTKSAETVLYETFSGLKNWRKGIDQHVLLEVFSKEFGAERANEIISDLLVKGWIARAESGRLEFLTKFTDYVFLQKA